MPALSRASPAVAFQKFSLLRGCHFRGFFGIEAHREDIELVPNIELQHSQRAFQSAEDFSAQHGTLVVNQTQDERPPAKLGSQANRFASLVSENKVRRNWIVQVLFNANIL